MPELYQSKSEEQVTPFPEKGEPATKDNLFKKGFEDDITPLDQYNLNLLIRAIKENLIRIEQNTESITRNKSNSDTEIEDIKQHYLTINKLLEFLQSGTPTTITNPITFDSPISAITPEIDEDPNSSAVSTVKYVNDILDDLVLCVDGGKATDVNTVKW